MVVQNGPEAGQTIKHSHIHILPRETRVERENDGERQARTEEDMAKEAENYRQYF